MGQGLCLKPRLCASAGRMTKKPFIIGTRGSPLALAQARLVAAALAEAHGWGEERIRIAPIRTSGDRIQDRPLADIGGKTLWTKELDLALLTGETDCSVHSMKDVESERPPELIIAGMLPRADVRDRLIGAAAITELGHGAIVGTSSPRRSAQLKRLRPDLRIVPIRGNVDTRLGKCAAGEVDATLLAAAGLDRLGRREVGTAIEVGQMLPAPAQGAVGIECRTGDATTAKLLAAIDHHTTHAAVAAERAFTRALGGTCHSPVAALAILEGGSIRFAAQLLSEDGGDELQEQVRFALGDAEAPTLFGRAMLARAPKSIRRLFEP